MKKRRGLLILAALLLAGAAMLCGLRLCADRPQPLEMTGVVSAEWSGQDVQALFLKKTVREDLCSVLPKQEPGRAARVRRGSGVKCFAAGKTLKWSGFA